MNTERECSAKAPVTIQCDGRTILWSLLSRDESAQLLLPAAAFCSDSERSYERLLEVIERQLFDLNGAHVAIVRDDIAVDGSSESALTLELLHRRGALSVSQLLFKGGQLIFDVSKQSQIQPDHRPISVVISYSKALSRTTRCEGSFKHSCTDLLRVLDLLSSSLCLALAPCFSMMFRISRSPTFKCSKEPCSIAGASAIMCTGEFSYKSDQAVSTWFLAHTHIFHALSDRKLELTAVANFRSKK
jgi:hypothetical protein